LNLDLDVGYLKKFVANFSNNLLNIIGLIKFLLILSMARKVVSQAEKTSYGYGLLLTQKKLVLSGFFECEIWQIFPNLTVNLLETFSILNCEFIQVYSAKKKRKTEYKTFALAKHSPSTDALCTQSHHNHCIKFAQRAGRTIVNAFNQMNSCRT